jgi:hypothetical protein
MSQANIAICLNGALAPGGQKAGIIDKPGSGLSNLPIQFK